jgi:hypothetical protein
MRTVAGWVRSLVCKGRRVNVVKSALRVWLEQQANADRSASVVLEVIEGSAGRQDFKVIQVLKGRWGYKAKPVLREIEDRRVSKDRLVCAESRVSAG